MNTVSNFYEIQMFETTAEGFRAEAVILPEHPVYAGHFPDRAVVPGVFLLEMIRDFSAMVFGHPVEYACIRECKFLSALLPSNKPVVSLTFVITEQKKLSGTVRCESDLVMKLKAVLQ